MKLARNVLDVISRLDLALHDLLVRVRPEHGWVHFRVVVYNGKSDEVIATFDTRHDKAGWVFTDEP